MATNAPRFYTASGRLTPYAFACGYTENRARLTLSQQHGVYHVKGFREEDSHVWESALTLTEARKILRSIK